MNEEECPETPGKMVASQEYTVKGLVYLFDNNGGMQTGWVSNNGWYYYNASGAKQTDWIKLKNLWYYLKETGAMATGWVKTGGRWYYMNKSGAMQTGWLAQGQNWYYLYKKNDSHGGPEGAMASNTVIDGWVVAPDGIYNTAYQNAYKVLNQVGWNLRAAYNWSAGLKYYRM